MQQEFRSNQSATTQQQHAHHYAELASMLVLFLHSPSPDLQHRLSQFSPALCLQLILNPSQPREVRQACCASLKAQILNRSLFNPHAGAVIAAFENIHFTADPKQLQDIAGSFEILQEKLFEMYLDDEKKLQAFAGIMQRISNNSSLSSAAGNLRGIQMAVLLVRAMDVGTINNQVCIGELICYLKQLYYPKNIIAEDPKTVNGRGLDLLRSAMGEKESEGVMAALLDTQIQAVKLISEIIQRVESDIQQGQSVPTGYIRNSGQIDNLFQAILCVSPSGDGRIYSSNRQVNQLKAALMSIYIEQYSFHISQPLLLLCFSTIAKCNPQQLYDDVDVILSGVLQLVERSSSHGEYAQFYYSNTQIMIIRLFELSAPREAELKAAEEDPQHFADIADDYCKSQESESVKIRAGSLIDNLCLTIDGTLTFVTNMAMIPLYALEGQLGQQLSISEGNPRELCIQNGKGLPVLLELWSGRPETLTDVSLLVLSCLSDLIIKRNQFNHGIRLHLQAIAGFFHHHRERVLALLPPSIIARYIQLFSFYSYPHCMDPFLPLYPLKPLFAQTILKSLETLMHFHDKKSPDMRNYVSLLSTKILLLSEKLTPLLEQTIISRPELILCIKEKLVQKLVNWLLNYYEKGNTFGSNKISNLLCKVIEQYPKFMIETEDFSLDLQALNAYLMPIYRLLQRQEEQYNSQECLVDIAVQHLQCLGVRVQGDLLQKFVGMGVSVVQHNGLVLNKCLQLFSRTMAVPGMHYNRQRLQYAKLHKMHVDVARHLLPIACNWLQRIQRRDYDLWQLLFLIEILLVTLLRENPMISSLSMPILLEIYTGTTCEVVKLRVIIIWMLVMQITRDERCQASQCLQSYPIPDKLPPYQRNNFMIYLMGTLEAYSSNHSKTALLTVLLKMFHPSDKDTKYITNYETSLHVSNNHSQAQISAFQTVQTVLHPLNAIGIDTYAQFRSLCQRLPDWQQLRSSLKETQQAQLRNVLGKEMVGAKPRRIVHIKRAP